LVFMVVAVFVQQLWDRRFGVSEARVETAELVLEHS
jgi:hypothetical protein